MCRVTTWLVWQAYGKSLRTVKSCVGSTWCRYGQQDAVTMAVTLEDRYKGLRSPHKLKMACSGCLRECAEAQGKDVGLIATQAGYNLYVCGNGGARPAHAQLLASDVDEATCLKFIDRFLMFYISTAKHLQRTAPWLKELPGGMAYLKRVVVEDSLGIGADLEAMFLSSISNYTCEWKEVAYDVELQRKFQQFANTPETQDSEQLPYVDMRKHWHPEPRDAPDLVGPALYKREEASDSWQWVFAGYAKDFPKNGGMAVKHGRAELAVFHLPGQAEEWLATQNRCPFKQAQVMSRSLVGETPGGVLTVADPVYKTTYDLRTGQGISNPHLNLSTFQAKVENDQVLLLLPPAEELAHAWERQVAEANEANASTAKPAKPAAEKADPLDW